ncbi:MAG: SBBP repeat-containing protein [Candidatus Brocadiia bacterium]
MKLPLCFLVLGLSVFALVGCGGGSTGSSGGLLQDDQSVVPEAPSALTVTALGNARVSLRWTDNSGNEDGFRVERRIGAGGYSQLTTLGSNATSYTDITVGSLTQYYYRIIAYNAIGDSAISNEVSVTPPLVKTWGGLGFETSNSVSVDGTGNIYVAGWTSTFGAITSTPPEAFVIKYDAQGNLLWQKTWGGLGSDGANAVAVTQVGDVYVTGITEGFGVVSTTDVFVLKYTTDGVLSWQKTWGGNGVDVAYNIAIDDPSTPAHIYVTGVTNSFGSGNNDAFLLSYDTAGALSWQRVWGGPGDDQARGLDIDIAGNIYVVGGTNSFASGSYDAFIIKYDAAGALTWQRLWGGAGDEIAKDIVVDSLGNLYMTGDCIEYGTGAYNIFLASYNSTGTSLWQSIWGGALGDDIAGGIAINGSNVYIGGYSNSFSNLTNNIFVIRTDLSGNILYQGLWETTGSDNAYDIAADASSNVFIAGETNGANGELKTISGTVSESDGISSTATGIPITPTGSESTPAGYEDTPAGIETGSSNLDMTMVKIRF